MLNPSLIVNADTALNRGVCLSDRDIQIAISAIEYIQSRYAWYDMNDLDWDSLEGDLGQALTHILDNSSCGGGSNQMIYTAKVKRNTAQSGSGGYSINTLSFNVVSWDYGGFFDTNNPDKLTIPSGLQGLYTISANICFQAGSGARFVRCWLEVNDAIAEGIEGDMTQYEEAYSISTDVILAVGDTVKLKWSAGSGNRNTSVDYIDTSLSLIYVGDNYAT